MKRKPNYFQMGLGIVILSLLATVFVLCYYIGVRWHPQMWYPVIIASIGIIAGIMQIYFGWNQFEEKKSVIIYNKDMTDAFRLIEREKIKETLTDLEINLN